MTSRYSGHGGNRRSQLDLPAALVLLSLPGLRGFGGGRNNVRSYGMPAGPAARGTNPLNKNLGDKVPRSPAAAPRSTRTLPLTRGLRWVALPRGMTTYLVSHMCRYGKRAE
jgi:hypothetical protein